MGWNGQGEVVCLLRGQSLEARLCLLNAGVLRATRHVSETASETIGA
jgi:hypothetical protein